VKDAVGNELKIGDLVAMQLERPLIYGRIVELREGGVITGLKQSGAEMQPGRVLVMSQYPLEVDPRLPVRALVALRDPDPEAMKVIESGVNEELKPN
jgi:hypothetical protein